MRRYSFLTKDYVYEALNKLRAAFLAAKDGNEVEEIIKGVLTNDERLKIGRRIQIAQMLQARHTYKEIKDELKVGVQTIELVNRKINSHPTCYDLINKREEKVESVYKSRAYVKIGGPKLVHKKHIHTGFKRKDVNR